MNHIDNILLWVSRVFILPHSCHLFLLIATLLIATSTRLPTTATEVTKVPLRGICCVLVTIEGDWNDLSDQKSHWAH